MKKTLLFLLGILCTLNSFSQNPWTIKTPFGGGPRAATVGFSIGHYGFIGCGTNIPIWNYTGAQNDFWRWDEFTNTWTQIANYPGASKELETGFTIEGKGYVGFGWAGSSAATDLWRYDTITNAWAQMATFPGLGRYDVSDFVIGHKVYIIEGNPSGPPYFSDVWVYDAHANTWKQLGNFPVPNLEGVVAFSIGNHGYAGDGYNNPGCSTSMFEYDTTTDTWIPMAPIPVPYGDGGNSTNCTIGSRAYIFNGDKCNVPGVPTGFCYDTVTKSWCAFTDMATSTKERAFTSAFVIDNHIYMGTGYDTLYHNLGDFVEYTPSTKMFVKDTNLCVYDSVRFSDSSSYLGNAWNWSFVGGSPSISTKENPSVYYSATGNYTVRLILSACGVIDTIYRNISVTSGKLSSYSIKGADSACPGTPDTLTATGGGTYLWSNGATTSSIIVSPASSKTYSVTITKGGCIGDTNIQVNVIPIPDVTLTVQSRDTVCSDAGAILLFGNPNGGTFSGSAVHGKFFYPDSAIIGKYNLIYYSDTATSGCFATATDSIYVENCTGINILKSGVGNVTIFPNPGNGILNIVYTGTIRNGILQITDLLGRMLDFHEINGTNGRMTINETPLNNGMYFYQVLSSGKLISSGKFIIAK